MYNLGQYIPGASPVHRMDPRVKLVGLILFSVMVLRAGLWEGLLLSAALLIAVRLSGLKREPLRRALTPAVPLAVILLVVHLFFTDGRPLLSLPHTPLKITQEGLSLGLMTAWQVLSLVLGAAILTLSTTPSDLIHGIEKLLAPLKAVGLPSHDLAMMLAMALRFVPTCLEEYDRIRTAHLARGSEWGKGSPWRRVQTGALMALSLALSSLRRADTLVEAMEARGYLRGPRTHLRVLRMSPADYGALILLTAGTTLLAILGSHG